MIKYVLIHYWKLILTAFFLLLSFILHLVKKKPLNDIISVLLPMCVSGIKYAESCDYSDVFHKSEDKLSTAVGFVVCNLCDYFGLDRTGKNVTRFDYLRPLIKKLIEDILSTPQKKGSDFNG